MPKKTTVLIIILAIVTVVLLFLAISAGNKQGNPLTNTTPTKHVVQKTATVFFSPSNIDISSGSASASPSVDVMVDSGNGDIAGVQAELQYDPKAISNVTLIPASDTTGFFGPTASVLFNDAPTPGRLSYAIAISPGQPAIKGKGKIATLTFQKAPGATVTSTTIKFIDKTLVTKLGESESVLKESVPLNITLGTGTPVVVPQTTQAPLPPVTTAPAQ